MPYNNIIYATEQEARYYYLPLSSQALFMDPNQPTFYFKSVDAFGQPDFIIADFTIRNTNKPAEETPLTRADLDALKQELMTMIGGTQHDEQQSVNPTLSATTNN